jgi:hypothetical protein
MIITIATIAIIWEVRTQGFWRWCITLWITGFFYFSETLCSLVFFRIPDDGQSPKTQSFRITWDFGLSWQWIILRSYVTWCGAVWFRSNLLFLFWGWRTSIGNMIISVHTTAHTIHPVTPDELSQYKTCGRNISNTSMKIYIFWDEMPCSPLNANRRFGGKCRLHLQVRRISQARNQNEAGSKHSLTFNGLHGVISQTTEHFIATAVRNSNLRSCLIVFRFRVFVSIRQISWRYVKTFEK